jgi:hypothetical protein
LGQVGKGGPAEERRGRVGWHGWWKEVADMGANQGLTNLTSSQR